MLHDLLEKHSAGLDVKYRLGFKYAVDLTKLENIAPGVFRKEIYYDTLDLANLSAGITIRKVSIQGHEDTWEFKWARSETECKVLRFADSKLPQDFDLSDLESLAVIRVVRFQLSKSTSLDVCCFDVDDFFAVATDYTNHSEPSTVNGKLHEYLLYHSDWVHKKRKDELLKVLSPITHKLNIGLHYSTPVLKVADVLDSGLSPVGKQMFKVNREIELGSSYP